MPVYNETKIGIRSPYPFYREDSSVQGCDTVSIGIEVQMWRSIVLPLSSEQSGSNIFFVRSKVNASSQTANLVVCEGLSHAASKWNAKDEVAISK
jgi:hypothetical protein